MREHWAVGQGPKSLRVSLGELLPKVPYLEAELPDGKGDGCDRAPRSSPGAVKTVPAGISFICNRCEVGVDGQDWTLMVPEAGELGVSSVAA